MKPLEFQKVGTEELLVTWEDGHRSLYRFDYLRLQCPCAQCCDEWSGRRMIQPDQIQKNIKLQDSKPVGNYGIRFLWSDGHQTGIYSFDHLRKICRCGACVPADSVKGNQQ